MLGVAKCSNRGNMTGKIINSPEKLFLSPKLITTPLVTSIDITLTVLEVMFMLNLT